MKDLKNIISNTLGLVILLCAALLGLIKEGTLDMLPEWVTTVCLAVPILATVVISWMTGKNPDLTAKTKEQLDSKKSNK